MKNSHPIKIFGGKYYLASWLHERFPPHKGFISGCAGGLHELLGKKYEGIVEIVNDIDLYLTMFWKVLSDSVLSQEFIRRANLTPFSSLEFEYSKLTKKDYDFAYIKVEELMSLSGEAYRDLAVDMALKFFITSRMSLMGMGRNSQLYLNLEVERGMNEQVSAWLSAVEGLPEVCNRMRRVLVLNMDVEHILSSFDFPNYLIYLDPPYLSSTRVAKKVYRFEMPYSKHKSLLEAACKVQNAMVAISGYDSELYSTYLGHWCKDSVVMKAHSSFDSKEKFDRIEILWMNYTDKGEIIT